MSSKLTPQDTTEDEFEDELKPGTELLHGQYVIEQFLNNGGFGITYLAKDSLLRLVVIKECFPESICRRANSTVRVRSRDQAEAFRAIVDLFIEEARGLARLSHPNIVGVHQVFEDNDTAYMAMDFVEGRDLLEIAETSATIEPKELEIIAYKLLDAIEFIHNEGVLHRDISPDNILLSKENEPVLIDFGAARETVTRETSYLGSMRTVKDGYSPQEFYMKSSEQHPSSDLYSLAASLYHVMSKELPANAQTRVTAIANGDPDPYVSIRERVTGYSEPFLDAIDHALKVFPKERIQSAGDWRAMISDAIAPNLVDGKVSRPMLAVDNGNVLEQYEEKERKSFLRGRKSSAKQVSVRAERPASELAPGQRDIVSSQAQVARAMAPSTSAGSGKGMYIGVAAVAIMAVVGAGALFMGGGSDADVEVAQTEAGGTAVDGATSGASQELADNAAATTTDRASNRPEQVPFFLADSSSGDVVVSAPRGSRLTAADTGPIASAQRPVATPSQPIEGTGSESQLAAAQPVTTTNASLPAGVNVIEESAVLSGAEVEFTVTRDPEQPNIVASVSGPAAEHLEPGLRVVSINGFPIQSLDEFQRVVDATSNYTAGQQVSVAVGIENPGTGQAYVRDITLPTHHKTMLLNGVSFQSVQDGQAWVTTVTNGAGTGEAELQTGDRVIALMPNNELIDAQDTLSRLMERELEAGVTQFNFAVERDGNMWLVTMPYSAEP